MVNGIMTYEYKLKKDFLRVVEGQNSFYGGAQEWSQRKNVKGYGCGVVACANVLLHWLDSPKGEISKEQYIKYAKALRCKFLPVIPRFGINGILMALGMNVCLLFKRAGAFAYWGCFRWNIFKHIERMLSEDIPVVLAAGPNWPNLFGNHRLNMYMKSGEEYRISGSMRAHYVTVTAMDEEWMTVSSWGRKYYINRNEYTEYVKKYSNYLFSSILVIKKFR